MRFAWPLALLLALGLPACGEPDEDNDGSPASVDCDDQDPFAYLGAPELCDGVDNNCNDQIDEGAVDAPYWYFDRDGDEFGDDNLWERACEPKGVGWVAQGGDCDDLDNDAWPGNAEVCDEADNDCDGAVDEGSPEAEAWYADNDKDGFGDPGEELRACYEPPGFVKDASDCDDSDATQNPEADEYCNGEDDDCDGSTDEAGVVDGTLVYEDKDADGLGDPSSERAVCDIPGSAVLNGDDCDDSSEDIKSGCTCSDFSDGELILEDGEDRQLEAGEHHFTTVQIPRNSTLTFRGPEPVYLFANSVTIEGTIVVAGANGDNSASGSPGNGGDAGPGGGGGGGGGNCGNGAGSGGFPNGESATGPSSRNGGNGGLGFEIAEVLPAFGGHQSWGSGGGGGGHEARGGNGGNANSNGGYGGERYGEPPLEREFAGGGGGAGGAGNGGGGGGGGGAIAIWAAEIDITESGDIDADGGNGGVKNSGGCTSGGGGGGAGGAIWLHADKLRVSGSLSALGGRGGSGGFTNYGGGGGADGRIRLSAPVRELEARRLTPRAYEDFTAPACPRPDEGGEEG